jgi:hypothetical protein
MRSSLDGGLALALIEASGTLTSALPSELLNFCQLLTNILDGMKEQQLRRMICFTLALLSTITSEVRAGVYEYRAQDQ